MHSAGSQKQWNYGCHWESSQCDPCISRQAPLALVGWEELAGPAQLRPRRLVDCCSRRASSAMSGAVNTKLFRRDRCSSDPAACRMAARVLLDTPVQMQLTAANLDVNNSRTMG